MPQIKSVDLPTGVTLQYAEQGDPAGTPVLLLHGLADSFHSFDLVLPHLPGSIRALALTQRGHGDSSRPQEDYHYTHHVADAVAFLDALHIPAAVVVGHSLGNTTAQRFAIDYPERTMALCLVAAAHRLANTEAAQILRDVVAQIEGPVDQPFAEGYQKSTLVRPVPPAFLDTVVRETMKVPAHVWKGVVAGFTRDDFSSELHRITAPTLLVRGDQDEFATQSDQEAQLAAIADSRLKVYEGSGHAVHWEQPERFATDLVSFIEEKVK